MFRSLSFIVAVLFCGCDNSFDSLPVPRGFNGDCSRFVLEALDRNDLPEVKRLTARGGVVVCDTTSWRMGEAIRKDQIPDLALLLDAGADPNRGWGEFSQFPIFMATEKRIASWRLPLGVHRSRLRQRRPGDEVSIYIGGELHDRHTGGRSQFY